MAEHQKKIWIIGAGAVGSALAALLADKGSVTLVGDSPHARAVRKNGLQIGLYEEAERVIPVAVRHTTEITAMGPDDWIILAGKIWALTDTAQWLKKCIHPGQWVLALQNGMGFEAELEINLGIPVHRGIVQFGANSTGRGDVRFYRGKLIMPPSKEAEILKGWLAEKEVVCEITLDFRQAQWHKLLINCVANPLAGLLRINNRAVADPDLNAVKKPLLAEVKAVAAAEGVTLDVSLDQLNAYFKSENVPSLVRDLERGKPTEVDFINGYVAVKGDQHGIATPINSALTAMVNYASKSNDKGREDVKA